MKKNLLFKIISLSLLLSLTAQFSACGDTSDNKTYTDTTRETDLISAETELTDGLGDYDFNGAAFNIVTCEGYFFSPYDVEAETGDLLDDAAYQRNRTIEDRFNCDIVYNMLSGSGSEPADAIRNTVAAGDDAYQLGIVHPYIGLSGLITGAYVLDMSNIPNLNYDKPWWNATFNKALSIGNILPCASSDFIYFNSGCIYFNKELAGKYNIEDPYQLVYEGKWTWDKLAELAVGVASDLNGDGKMDTSDQYGYSIINNHRMIPVTYSYGISPSSKSDGYITLENLGSDKMHEIVENYFRLIHENEGALLLSSDELIPFRDGRVLFLHYVTQNIKALRDLEWDFGILPMPKYDEAQQDYYSLAQSNVMVIPATVSNTEFVGTIIEALSAYSYFHVLPALYETTFNNKYLRDEDSIAMFDIIKNSLIYDPLWNYNTSNNIVYFLSTLMKNGSVDTASFYAANHESAELELRKFFDEALEAYENN
ncbi:MAG: hypothetical protein ACI3XM_11355 [Eubacteriales bacterium]